MHLLIDGQALQTSSSRQRGIGRYASNFLRGLAVVRPNWRIDIVQNRALTPIAADNRHGLPVLSFRPPLPPHVDYHEINDRYYADWLTAQRADAVLVPSFCEGWDAILPSFCGRRPRLFGIVHDLIPLLYPEHYLPDFHGLQGYAHRFRQLLQCDALLFNSEATGRDVRALGGVETPLVVNIAGAADPLFTPLSPRELVARVRKVRKRFRLRREFLLYVGAPDYRKNLHGAIRAFAGLPDECRADLDLAVVCRMKPAERETVQSWAQQAGVASALRLICSADDEDLRTLYSMCRLFFFPSLYEGLGLPVLEALHCGAPVVTSDRSSLPEYAGPHSWLCDPESPQAMTDALQQALAEPRDQHRHERESFARTFSWEKSAERACGVMERIVRSSVHPVRRPRRLAWVLPLAKGTSRMADHAAALLPHLAEQYDIEVIAASASLEVPETLSRSHLVLTAAEVPARHAALPYDMFVYQLSPPPRHPHMLDLLRRYPGLVVLHDFSAADLRRLAESKLLPPPGADDFTPVLGMVVHTAEAWRQVQRASNVPLLYFSLSDSDPSQSSAASEDCAAAYSAWIDQAIRRHEQNDGPWRGSALGCLADCPDAAGAIVDSWTDVRTQGQQYISSRRMRSLGVPLESAAALASKWNHANTTT